MVFDYDQVFDAIKVQALTILMPIPHFLPAIVARFNWDGTGGSGSFVSG